MMHWRILKSRWVGVVAVLLAVLVIAACTVDPTPTPTPEPTATPVPPSPTPEPTQPPMTLEDLRITPATTGQALVAHVSEAEAACLSSAMGDANLQLFQNAPVVLAVANQDAYTLFANCLEKDNLVALGIGLMGINMQGWSDETLDCAIALGKEHPELVYLALNVADWIADPFHPDEIHSVLLDLYECLNIQEKVAFNIIPRLGTGQVAPFTGQMALNVLTEAEVECLQTNLPGPVFAMIANAPSLASDELAEAPPQLMACITPDSLARLRTEILINSLGAASDDSRNCIFQFAAEHSHYVDLVRRIEAGAEELSPDDFLEIAEDGFKLISCLSDEELAQFQRLYLPLFLP